MTIEVASDEGEKITRMRGWTEVQVAAEAARMTRLKQGLKVVKSVVAASID